MPYFEPGRLRIAAAANYVSQALTSGVSRQPNLERATLVVTSWQILTTNNNDQGRVVYEVSPDNSVWTQCAVQQQTQENNSADHSLTPSTTYIVPAGYWYRATEQTISNSPSFAFFSNHELTL